MTSVNTELVLVALSLALVMLAVARERTQRTLIVAGGWLERNARTIAAAILILLAAVLGRNGVAGLAG